MLSCEPVLTLCVSTALQQVATGYTRKSDGLPGSKREFELSDASRRSIRATVFAKPDENLELSVGMVVVLRGTLGIWQNKIAIRAFCDGVTCDESSEDARALAEQWHRACWSPTPLMPRWDFVTLDALVDRPAGALVDVCGVVFGLDAPVEYQRQSDGTFGWKRRIELCDECNRCVHVTLWLDAEMSHTLERGMVVGLRAAKVSLPCLLRPQPRLPCLRHVVRGACRASGTPPTTPNRRASCVADQRVAGRRVAVGLGECGGA